MASYSKDKEQHTRLGRLGGDELTVVLTDLNESHDMLTVAEKISDALEARFLLQSDSAAISASIGISLCPQDATTPKELLRIADRAMYQAKTSDRTKICFHDSADGQVPKRDQGEPEHVPQRPHH